MTNRDQLNILTKILIDTELKNTQNEFLKKNSSVFVDKIENKDEYSRIHGEYVFLMDFLMETTAKTLGTPVDLKFIKEEFKKDPKAAGDSHVIETLFSITDFSRFKELMVA